MPARSQTHLLHRFCTLVATHTAAEVPDRELVERFTRQRDESAFEVLLRRHGPMVWRLCRRVLRHEQDAEDAFQATFVVLARKAPSLRRQEAVGAWLYGVARRIALKARARDARRRERESLVPERSPLDPLDEISVREAQTVLDEELLRLPARYQAAVLLCCLEGLTRDEAAARIGVSVSTLKSRLEEGRRRLRERLARRGLSLSAVLASALLGAPVSAALPPRLLTAALSAATSAPFSVAQAVLTFVAGARLKLGVLFVAITGLLVGGLALDPSAASTDHPAAGQPPQQAAPQTKARADHLGDPLPPGALMRLGTLRHQVGWRFQFLADGKTSVSLRGERLCWADVATSNVRCAWTLPAGHAFLAVSDDGKQAVLSEKATLSLWDTVKGERLRTLAAQPGDKPAPVKPGERRPAPSGILFSPDGRSIAGTGYVPFGYHVWLWNSADGRMLWEGVFGRNDAFRNFKFGVERPGGSPHLAFLPDGETLVLLNDQGHQFQLRDRATGQQRAICLGLNPSAHYRWAVTPDGKAVVAVSPRDGLRLWEPEARRHWIAPFADMDRASVLAFAADGKTLLLAGDGNLRVRDWPSGKLRRSIDLAGRSVQQILPSRDGRTAYLFLTNETTLRHFDLDMGKETTPPHEGHRGIVSEFSLAPDGKVVSAGHDGSVQVWDLARGRAANSFRPKNGCIFCSLSGDGKLVAAADWEPSEVAIHERDTGRLVRTIATAKPIRYLAFAPGSRLLLTGEDIPARLFRVWDADTGRELRRLDGEVFARPAFSPDGRLLAAVSSDRLRVFDFARGSERFTLPAAGRHGLAFSADGKTLACGDWKAITLWEVATQRQRQRIELTAESCTAPCFSADGRWLAWGEGADVRLWDLRRNTTRHVFRGHLGHPTNLLFPPDGRTLISSSIDSTLLVWDLTPLRDE